MTSRVLTRFLATNDAPSDQETLEVWGIGNKAQRDLRANAAQMSLLPGRTAGPDAFMEAVRRQDASLRQTIQLCRCILSPLRRFPPEILAHIFFLSAPSVAEARHVPWYRSLERSPWTLAHVSRYWRAVALTTPALWSSITIRNMSDPRTQIYSQRMLEAQLSRSGRAPLEIVFDYDPFNDESGSCVAEDALQTLAEHSERWKALYITGSQIARLAAVRGRLPLLEKLSVFGRDEEGTDDGNSPPPPVDYFLNAPRLRTIEVNQGLPFFAVPWTQLTHYEALGTWAGHISALVCLKNVESCSFTIAHEDYLEDPYAQRDETTEFPTLRQLQVTTERSYDHIEEYWVWPKWLRLPALTDLAIHAGLLYDLPELQLASAFSLNKLHLVAQYPAVEALRPVLLSNPHISELLLCVDGFRDFTRSKVSALLDFLTLRPHHPDLLAELETLIIHSFTTGNHEDAVGRMIESRWRTTRLRAVHAVDIGPGLTSQLSRLKSEGMAVFIRRTVSASLNNSYGDYKAPFQIDHWPTVAC